MRFSLRCLCIKLMRGGGPSSSKLRDDSHRRQAMRSLLIAIPTLLTLSFGAWAILVLVVLEH
jgi:hypothetical protein